MTGSHEGSAALGEVQVGTELAIVEALRGLSELATTINREHAEAARAVRNALLHALAAGDALIEARKLLEFGDWEPWLTANFEGSPGTARVYMRLASYRELVPPDVTQAQALAYLRGLPGINGTRNVPYSSEVALEARRLAKDGVSQRSIAEVLGASKSQVGRWVGGHSRGAYRKQLRRSKEARQALKRQERERAARKAGGSLAECYSLIRKVAQELDRAADQTEDREIRAALKAAITDVHNAEDDIALALGVEHGGRTRTMNATIAKAA